VARKSPEWLHIMSRIFDICAIRTGIEDQAVIQTLVATKRARLTALIAYCRDHGCQAAATYLENAEADWFTAMTHRLEGKTTSRVERLMRTVNLRVNVGKWSTDGVLNAVKVRLAYYYKSEAGNPANPRKYLRSPIDNATDFLTRGRLKLL